MSSNNTAVAVTLAIVTTLVGSLAAASAKHISTAIHPHIMVCTQYLICLLTLTPWVISKRHTAFKTNRLGLHLFRGVVGWACFYTYYYALGKIPLVDASLLRNTAPLCVPFIVMIWLKHKISGANWIGILIGFLGVAIILKPSPQGMDVWHFVGFLSGVGLALSMVSTKELSATESGNTILLYYFLISLILSLPFAIYHWQPIQPKQLPFLALIGFSIFITMKLYTLAYSKAPTSLLAPFSYFGVVFAGLIGWLIWDHIPDMYSLIGIVLVISGGVITLAFSNRKPV